MYINQILIATQIGRFLLYLITTVSFKKGQTTGAASEDTSFLKTKSHPLEQEKRGERQRRRIAQFLSERLIWENVCPFLFRSVASRRRRKIDKWRLYSIAHRIREGRGKSDMGLVAEKNIKTTNYFKNG